MPLNYRAIFEASPNPYLVFDRSFTIVEANPACLKATRRRLDEVIGQRMWVAYPMDAVTLQVARNSFERVLETCKPDTMPLLRFDIPRCADAGGGFERRYWSVTHLPVLGVDGEVEAVLQHPIDVTSLERLKDATGHAKNIDIGPRQIGIFERAQQVQEANLVLRDESALLRDLFAQAPSFMAVLRGSDHRFELANTAYCKLVGHRDLVGRTLREVFSDKELGFQADVLDNVYATRETFVGRGIEVFLADGHRRVLDFVYQPIFDAAGAVAGIFVEGNDVTEVRETLEALQQREARLRLVIAGAKDHAIFTTDEARIITEWSPGAERIFGWNAEEAVGRNASLLFTADDVDAGVDIEEFALAAREGSAPDKRWHVRKDGSRVFMRGSTNALRPGPTGELQGFLNIARDETERRRMDEELRSLNENLEQRVEERSKALLTTQEQLRQSQKMDAIGQLTGGIAHDFNNLLATITSSLELMSRKIGAGHEADLTRYVTMASTSAQRAAALIQRLLAFSRKQSLDLQPVEVNVLIADMEDMLRRSLGESIQFALKLQAGLPAVQTDRNQLENALLNLVINARDAMPRGGTLEVATGHRELDAAYVVANPEVEPGLYVVLSVSDNGIGMPAEVVARAFDPFFTTKPIGQGTGLGLSMINGFARQTGGHASIHSVAGEGTTVNLYLPCNLEPQVPVTREQSITRSPQGSGETVLFVEDEPGVRGVVAEVLDELGYVTHQAIDAQSAMALQEDLGQIDLLITDVGLPGMNGRQLAEAMQSKRPGLKVLFVTGYASQAADLREFLEPGMDILAKPFTIDAMAHKVREILKA